jgi:hypothetical protein
MTKPQQRRKHPPRNRNHAKGVGLLRRGQNFRYRQTVCGGKPSTPRAALRSHRPIRESGRMDQEVGGVRPGRSRGKNRRPQTVVSFSPGLRGTSYPRVCGRMVFNPDGVASRFPRRAATPLGLLPSPMRPKVARSSQPWASCRNPFGIHPCSPKGISSKTTKAI